MLASLYSDIAELLIFLTRNTKAIHNVYHKSIKYLILTNTHAQIHHHHSDHYIASDILNIQNACVCVQLHIRLLCGGSHHRPYFLERYA